LSRPGAKAYDPLKRGLDIVGASIGLIVLSPVLLVTAVAVAVKLGTPVIFRQERPGRDARIFTLNKFRSMKDVDVALGLIDDKDRMTPFGTALRSTSIDELPALWNVLRGDMSIVGPRPLLVRYLPRYSTQQARRHDVRPGITGLAQVSGRNDIEWARKFDLDIEYVEKRSFWLDAQIVARTVGHVFSRTGITAQGHATSHEFLGDTGSPLSPGSDRTEGEIA
jgi:lipopolysaccharide/colanic/teichoic acid biosynthesis glycosyltransferase